MYSTLYYKADAELCDLLELWRVLWSIYITQCSFTHQTIVNFEFCDCGCNPAEIVVWEVEPILDRIWCYVKVLNQDVLNVKN